MEAHNYSAQDVANVFLKQYYEIMQEVPEDGFKFYKEQSTRSHPCADGSMKSATTLEGINDDIMASIIKKWNPDLNNVQAQDSVMESVIIGVSGSLTDNAGVARNFTQTFVLAPQEGGGFYVHNDVLQFVEIIMTSGTSPPLDDMANPPTVQQGDVVAESSKGKNILPAESKKKCQPSAWQPAPESSKGKNILPAEPHKKSQASAWQPAKDSSKGKNILPAEPQKKSQASAWQPAPESSKGKNILPAEPQKKSQASAWQPASESSKGKNILPAEPKQRSQASAWQPAPESSKGKNILPAEPKQRSQPLAWQPVPNMQEETTKVSYAKILAKEGSGSSSNAPFAKTEKQTGVSPAVPKPSVFPEGPSTIPNSGPFENIYDVKAIRVKNLPPNMTQESLLEVVKQFGPVKQNNIQIKEYAQDGYRYAFVEFDDPKSAHSAIKARVIHFGDRYSEIEYKKLPNQGGHYYTARPSYGQGGYRNNNFWGHDGEGQSSSSWGHKHNAHENSGQTREYNYRRNRYS